MCLIVFSWQQHTDYPLVLIANRDEFHARPTQPMHWWTEHEGILAGRDLQAGGTWFGLNRQGRFAAITNYRDPDQNNPQLTSRGEIPVRFLAGTDPADLFLAMLDKEHDKYNGFNLLLGEPGRLFYYSNLERQITPLSAGLYGLCNGLLDSPWPKVVRSKQALQQRLEDGPDTDSLLSVLRDETPADDEALPFTGISLEWERLLSPCFIRHDDYGTRSTSAMLLNANGDATVHERSFTATAGITEDLRFSVPAT